MLADLTNSGAIPVLEMSLRFAGQRQKLLAHNIANISTPNFIPADVSVADFRKTLRTAIDERRERAGGPNAPLPWRETRELTRNSRGELQLNPRTAGPGVLMHDRNNRDLEKLMQDQAENVLAYRVTTDLLKGRFDLMRTAISQRV